MGVKQAEKISASNKSQPDAVEDLRKNLIRLSQLHAKLRFMLKELETVVKK